MFSGLFTQQHLCCLHQRLLKAVYFTCVCYLTCYTQREAQVCSIWSQTKAHYALMLRTKRFQLSSVLFCSVCLPDVVFWFGAYSRNNTVTHKNRKWTQIYQLHRTCPAQSHRNSTSSRIQHSSSMACEFEESATSNTHSYPPQSYELINFQTSNAGHFKH